MWRGEGRFDENGPSFGGMDGADELGFGGVIESVCVNGNGNVNASASAHEKFEGRWNYRIERIDIAG